MGKFKSKSFMKFKQKYHQYQKEEKRKIVNMEDGARVQKTQNPQTDVSKAKLLQFKESLPISEAKDAIIEQIKNNKITILIGETASGKSTQIPQYLMEDLKFIQKGIIGVTQPRRVAATSLAKRVSEEQNSKIGQLVGYSVRFDDCISKDTKIKFMTDGILMRELLIDPALSRYSVIILDEAHERSVRTDILLGVIKGLILGVNGKKPRRPDLKLIVMSATLDADAFSRYFNNAPVLYVEGRMHPVRVFHSLKPVEDYIDAALVTIFQIHLNLNETDTSQGDILVFLTGQEEIEELEKLINEYARDIPSDSKKLLVYPLYANLPPSAQQKVFDETPAGCRKVILATNVAQTSITISGIKYVIDCGLEKSRTLNFSGFGMKGGVETLAVSAISKSSARQRMGRAGRLGPGICYRLYTYDTFLNLQEEDVPEIRKCNLSGLLLNMACSGLNISEEKHAKCAELINFDFMDRPSKESLMNAMEELHLLGAIDDTSRVTNLGKQITFFPLEPPLSKVLIIAKNSNPQCVNEVIDLVSLLSVENIFFVPSSDREKAAEVKSRFVSTYGDHITLLNLLNTYIQECSDSRKINSDWCKENYINSRSLHYVMETRRQIREFCQKQKIPIESPKQQTSLLHEHIIKIFMQGYPRNIAALQEDGTYKDLKSNQQVSIHPSSTLFNKKAKMVLYHDLVWTSKKYIKTLSIIN